LQRHELLDVGQASVNVQLYREALLAQKMQLQNLRVLQEKLAFLRRQLPEQLFQHLLQPVVKKCVFDLKEAAEQHDDVLEAPHVLLL